MAGHKNTPERVRLVAAIRAGDDIPLARNDFIPTATIWIGSKADLLATGICDEKQFPVAPKRLAWGNEDEIEDRSKRRPKVGFWLCTAIAGSFYEYRVDWDDDERRARQLQRIGLPPQPRPQEYASAEDFAESAEQMLRVFSTVSVDCMSGETERKQYGDCTVRYRDADVAKVRRALEHATQLLQSATPVRLVQKASTLGDSAKADPAFQRFMAAARTERSRVWEVPLKPEGGA